ncbi:RNA polymerase factor sigma-54 [Phosphitispora sp. TUW77]|uniref:RNA polymerase factor sigma-54 n=1 Tax=Phosphitispora sp. TUW77 TaxID=3152361 RepID=UPI003AB4DC5B
MRMGFGLYQEQTQKLIMTPELRLAIKILQLSTVELTELIENELVENPLLEIAESAADTVDVADAAADTQNEKSTEQELADQMEKVDIDWDQYFNDKAGSLNDFTPSYQEEPPRFENIIAEFPTLQGYLMFQLAFSPLNVEEKLVGEFFIGNIDDNGYLHCSVEEAAVKCSVPNNIAEKVLEIIQGMEPPGIGARNLEECLLIQYVQLELKNKLLKEIITNYLHEIAAGKIMKVAKKLGVQLHRVQEALDLLKLLEPKPGRIFSPADRTRYITPDVVVEKVDNEYIILVNDVSAPRLSVSDAYKNIVRGNNTDQESRKYVEEKLNSAVWLIRSIEQRREMLYKVSRCIVDYQRDFFDRGVKYLKSMNLRNVAETLDIHESTVSRATAGKYMQTPRGLFEMKFFFSSGVSNIYGTSTSAEAVKKLIKELVEAEDQYKPMSDQRIAENIQAKGVNISRRTVAKYRDEIGILPTSQRRRYKK